MIQNTLFNYVAIRICIASLQLIAPASIAYLVCCAFFRPQWWNTVLGAIAAVEASFYLFVYLPRRRSLQAPPTHRPQTLTRAQRRIIFNKSLSGGQTLLRSHTSDEQHPPYLTGWFLGLPPNAHPTREDAVDWLLWALFSTSREKIDMEDPELKDELNEYLSGIEKMLGRALDSRGSEENEGNRLRSMRITLDPVKMLHRPLAWYLIVALVDTYTSLRLYWLGFRHYTPLTAEWSRTFPPRPVLWLLSRSAPEGVAVPYWYRPHHSRTKMPLVFLHGIGIGLYPYIPFLRSLIFGDSKEETDGDIGILLPELMPISMHMTPRSVPPRAVMLASLTTILNSLNLQEEEEGNAQARKTAIAQKKYAEREEMSEPLLANGSVGDEHRKTYNSSSSRGWNRVVLAAHSYGTFVAGWIVRLCVDIDLVDSSSPDVHSDLPLSERVAHLVLVDPIPILLSHPAVAHNFLYRHPAAVCVREPDTAGDLHLELDSQSLAESNIDIHKTPASPVSTPDTQKKSQTKSWFSFSHSSASAWLLYYFASRDADVACTLHRAFFWSEGGIWKEEVEAFVSGSSTDSDRAKTKRGRNMAVFLGGLDQIVPAEAIRRYLTGEERWKERWVGVNFGRDDRAAGSQMGSEETKAGRLEVMFNPYLDHAVLFDEKKWTMPLMEVVRRYVRDM